jgi:sigma-B regulation protein RsbU (phosphoserine phosphatase)
MTEQVLRNIPLFAAIPSGELARLAHRLPQATYLAGTILMREGERGDSFYIVLSGQIVIISAFGTPDERVIGLRDVGEFVGEMSLLSQDGRRSATVQARSDARVLVLTQTDFDMLLHGYPMMAYDMLRLSSDRTRSTNSAMIGELQAQNRQITQALSDLQAQNQRLAQAYAELAAAQKQLAAKEALEHELQLAREIQESILPRRLPKTSGLDIDARMIAAREVGGDFFDVFPIGEGTLGLVVGDACDKGMPAAIFMALARSLLRAEASRAASPEITLRNVNSHIQDMNDAGMFITVLYGILHLSTSTFVYARAGHELPLLLEASGALRAVAHTPGHPLGLFPEPALDIQTVELPPGGLLLLFTDGVNEALDERGNLFGIERLHAAVQEYAGVSARRLCDGLLETLAAYRGAAPQADDITLLAVRSLPTPIHLHTRRA